MGLALDSIGQKGSTDGPGTVAEFYDPVRLALDDSGYVYVTDAKFNNMVRKIINETNEQVWKLNK